MTRAEEIIHAKILYASSDTASAGGSTHTERSSHKMKYRQWKELSYLYRRYPYPDNGNDHPVFSDYGPEPFVINIDQATRQNNTFRTALWTGEHLQLTLMSLNPGEDIGLEIHNVDQFLRIEQGQGLVRMGKSKDTLNFQRRVDSGFGIFVPAGTWHNVINTGIIPLKLYSIYAPPQHPRGTVSLTKADAAAAEHGR